MDPSQPTPSVLVIDDEPAIRDVMNQLLCDAGYRVTTRPCFFEHLDELLSLSPDVIVMDIMLQGKRSGIDFIERLRADPRTAPIPIAVCTGATHLVAEINAALKEWDCQLICKPFDIDDFITEINRCLARQRLKQAN